MLDAAHTICGRGNHLSYRVAAEDLPSDAYGSSRKEEKEREEDHVEDSRRTAPSQACIHVSRLHLGKDLAVCTVFLSNRRRPVVYAMASHE